MDTSYNILLTVMGMDIGGAETHVLELAKALKSRGFGVFVASKGGVYEKDLKENNIKHYKVPLNSRSIKNMVISYFALKRIIKDERIDIVHAHARIPAFICGLLHRKLKFPFITTVHGVYSTEFPLRVLTDWGQKTIAVSNDIKDYILDNYEVNKEDITVTINGIDTDKFIENTAYDDALDDLGLEKDKRRVVFVSRLDKDAGSVSFQLADAALALYEKIKNLEVLIVGSGTLFDQLKQKAAEINKKAGAQLIRLTGARTDINKLIATGEVFVGVSRAALEAMSAQKPVILAGNAGYLGILTSQNLKKAMDLNFTCRGSMESDKDLLYNDLYEILTNKTLQERQSLGEFGRMVVLDHYSLNKMAEDNINAYRALLSEKKIKKDVVISGYYGFKNNGDDALLQAIIKDLKQKMPEIAISVLSLRPKETKRIYNVDAVNRFNPFAILKIMKGAKLLISGGGSLIQDATSTQSLLYYVFIIKMAIKKGLKTMLYANGIGPVTNSFNRKLVSNVLNKMDLITLRENTSLKELKSLGVDKPKIKVTADPTFTIEAASKSEVATLLAEIGVKSSEQLCAISIRHWKNSAPDFESNIAKCADYIYEKLGLTPIFLSMQYPVDLRISKRVCDKTKGKYYLMNKNLTGAQMMGIIRECKMTIGMRLHTLIYSVAAGVPSVGIVYDPKIIGFMDYVGGFGYVNADNLKLEELKRLIDSCFNQKQNAFMDNLEKMRELSRENAVMAIKLIKEGSDFAN